jgi:ABC-2 type transport system ATP-binding protein
MKVRIEIDTKTFVRFWLVVMGFGLAGLAIYSAKDALVLLGISLFLALALNRPVVAIAKKLPGKSRLGGTALAYTTLVLLLGCVVWFVIPPIVQQSAKFVESIPSIIDQASSQWRGVNDFIDKNNLRPQVDSMMENIKQQSSSWATSVGTNLLSSNGSGKTTTLRALLGLYQPTAGDLLINSKPYSVESQIRLGYLPEERGLYKKEKVLDVMLYFGQLKGLSRKEAKDFSLKFLERVNLSDKANTQLDKLSGGQQQKIQLGVTIMGDPELLIMDEPAKGFDPVNRRLLMNIIEEQRKAGATIIYVTHQMEEVERLCDRLILLKDGQAAAYGTLEEVKKQFGG